MLQIGIFVAPVAPWHHTHRDRSWQRRRGGQNPERTPRFYSTENSEEPPSCFRRGGFSFAASREIPYKNVMCKLCNCCEKWSPYLLSLLRVVIGVLIMCHGGQKVFGYPATRMATPPHFSLIGIAGILELAGGLLVLLGLFTRPAAFILSGQMAVAYFMVHFPQAWWPIHNGGELAVIYCFVFFYLSAAGPGPLSLDRCRKCCATPSDEKTCCAAPPDEKK